MPVPKHIGRYPVERLLGSGAMGSVYLARDTELDRPVAIKTVHPRLVEHADSADILERLRNEARAVARVKHASIVEVYDVGRDPDVGPFLVFEYVEGKNLKQVLSETGPLPESLVLALADQIGDALARAHAAGIIHRDIKPENLLVGGDGRTRLLDFGVARLPDAVLTGEGQFLGTPAYSAPETLSRGVYSPASDQFSLAAVLFEVLTGRRVFVGDDALAVAHAVIHDDPPAPSEVAPAAVHVPGAVEAVVLRGLAKSPMERFESVPSLVAALHAAYGGRAVELPAGFADTLPQRPAPLSSREPRRAAAAWAMSVLGALLLGSFVVLRFIPSAAEGADEPDAAILGSGDELRSHPSGRPNTAEDPASGGESADAGASADSAAAVDSGFEDLSRLSAFEREERAKDALERVRAALSRADREAAQHALDEATRYDPEHPDIALLQRRLGTL